MLFNVCDVRDNQGAAVTHLSLPVMSIKGKKIHVVSALDLYHLTNRKQAFQDWCKAAFRKFQYKELQQYFRSYTTSTGDGHMRGNYYVTLEAASAIYDDYRLTVKTKSTSPRFHKIPK